MAKKKTQIRKALGLPEKITETAEKIEKEDAVTEQIQPIEEVATKDKEVLEKEFGKPSMGTIIAKDKEQLSIIGHLEAAIEMLKPLAEAEPKGQECNTFLSTAYSLLSKQILSFVKDGLKNK